MARERPNPKNRKSMTKIIFATSNQNKMREIREIVEGTDCEIITLADASISAKIEETGKTFAENALIKVRAIRPYTDEIILADDSGLEVDALGKAPGIYSSRWMGTETPYSVKNQAIIDKLAGKTGAERSARFVCAIAASLPDGRELTTEGTIEGQIADHPAGRGGFGYDPIVCVPELGKTTAELTDEEKNRISHRGKALRQMRDRLISLGWIAPVGVRE